MKDALLLSTLLVGIGEIFLAIYFFATHSRNEIRKVMALLASCTGVWVITNAVHSIFFATDAVNANLLAIHIFGLLTLAALVHFAWIFPYPLQRTDKLHAILFYAPIIAFCIVIAVPGVVIDGYTHNPRLSTGQVQGGFLFDVYNVALSVLFFTACVILFWKARNVDGIHRKLVKQVIVLVILAGVPAIFLNVWHIAADSLPNGLLGPLSSGIWLAGVTYIVRKK